MRKYIVLGLITVIIYFCQSFYNATGAIGADSLSYFGIASDLPRLKTNLFPLGFPVLLQFFHAIFNDYFWAGKMLNITMVVILMLFSYFKKFYFRETILLFAGKTLFFALIYVSSEGPFIFLLYFMVYLLHERFHDKITSPPFVFFASLLMILLFSVRYSGIYVYFGLGILWLSVIFNKRIFDAKKDLFWVLLFSGVGIAGYLGFNHYHYGSLTGENLRGKPEHYHAVYILRDLLGVTNVVNPFIGIKPASNSLVSLAFQVGLMLVDLMLLRYFIKLVRKKKAAIELDFHRLIWIIAGVYAITLMISGYVQQIEEMNVRMLAAANFCLFFSFLIIYFKDLESDTKIFRIACFFLFFLTAYSLKIPVNYLKNREQIEPQMPKFSNKKYLFNNERDGKESLTDYYIPVINKTFQYKHTSNQRGDVKHSIAGTINPQIKWLKYDTIKDKSQILYVSELILK